MRLARRCAVVLVLSLWCMAASACTTPTDRPLPPVTLRSLDTSKGLSLQLVVTRQGSTSAPAWRAAVTLHNARKTPVLIGVIPFDSPARPSLEPIALEVQDKSGTVRWSTYQGPQPNYPPQAFQPVTLQPGASLQWQISPTVLAGPQRIVARSGAIGSNENQFGGNEPFLATPPHLEASVSVGRYVTQGATRTWRDGLPQGTTLSSVTFADARRGWAVGGNIAGFGVILATSDGGAHWQAQRSGTDSGLSSVTFHGANNGWAVGGAGTILRTSDAGAHWRVQRSGTLYNLNSVTFADVTHGWAVGDEGVIISTSDGGQSWTPQTSGLGHKSFLRCVTFVDIAHGWAVGDDGIILATSDAGAHWTAQRSGTTRPLDSVCFYDAAHGWAVGSNGTIVATVDGGEHWTAQWSPIGQFDLSSVAFSDAKHGWAVGFAGAILSTSDGGAQWTVQRSRTEPQLRAIALTDARHAWAVGGTIFSTTDGGAHWTTATTITDDTGTLE